MSFLHHKNKDTGEKFYVYFIQQEGRGTQPVKIGYSKDPEKRLLYLQTGNPIELRIKVWLECDTEAEAVHLERLLHRIAQKKFKRLMGEWFLIHGDWGKLIESAYKSSTKLDKMPEVFHVKKQVNKKSEKIISENKRLKKSIEFLENIIQDNEIF